jgi:hypothetical protein
MYTSMTDIGYCLQGTTKYLSGPNNEKLEKTLLTEANTFAESVIKSDTPF